MTSSGGTSTVTAFRAWPTPAARPRVQSTASAIVASDTATPRTVRNASTNTTPSSARDASGSVTLSASSTRAPSAWMCGPPLIQTSEPGWPSKAARASASMRPSRLLRISASSLTSGMRTTTAVARESRATRLPP